METVNNTPKKDRKKDKKCSHAKDQDEAVLQALGNLEKKLDLLHELLLQSDSEQEDGAESLDDEENLSM